MIRVSVLRAMAAKGVSVETLLDAVEADQAAEAAEKEAKLAAKRENNAERQRRKRAKDKPEVTPVTRDIALQSVTAVTPPPTEPNTKTLEGIYNNPSPPKGGSAPKPKLRSGTRISAGWMPRAHELEKALAKLGSPERVEHEVEAFRDHFLARDGPEAFTVDWDARWRTWVRNAVKFDEQRRAKQGGGPRKTSAGDVRMAAMAEVSGFFDDDRGLSPEDPGEPSPYRSAAGGGYGASGRPLWLSGPR